MSRIVRDTAVSREVKELHEFQCQICGIRLECEGGPYAEAAHIRPLGAPHHGPDVIGNVLCLCPNHHVLFDHGALAIADDLSLIGQEGRLRMANAHKFTQLKWNIKDLCGVDNLFRGTIEMGAKICLR